MANTMTGEAVWTQEQPTKAGWYWCYYPATEITERTVVMQYIYPWGDNTFRMNGEPLEDFVEMWRPYWHGPLVPPMGPRAE
jgi:hypothetical protein